MDIEKILTEGIVFRGGKSSDRKRRRESKDQGEEENLYYRFAWFWLCQDESGISPSESQQTQTGMRVNKKLYSVVNIFVKLKKEDYEKIIFTSSDCNGCNLGQRTGKVFI